MTLCAYLSHPIGDASTADELVRRLDNIAFAHEWIGLLIEQTSFAVLCPWLAHIAAVGRTPYTTPRMLVDQVTLLSRCDVLVQVGAALSGHMRFELTHATREGIAVVDLTRWGSYPPIDQIKRDAIGQDVTDQLSVALTAAPRRVWLPPLKPSDLEALRKAERALTYDRESIEARAIIQAITAAALSVR